MRGHVSDREGAKTLTSRHYHEIGGVISLNAMALGTTIKIPPHRFCWGVGPFVSLISEGQGHFRMEETPKGYCFFSRHHIHLRQVGINGGQGQNVYHVIFERPLTTLKF